jgi:hypothetical protein
MTGNENSILVKIATDIGDIKTDVAVVKSDMRHLKADHMDMAKVVQKNTEQISEVRRKMHFRRNSFFEIGKVWPFIIGIVVSAVAVGTVFGDKLFK